MPSETDDQLRITLPHTHLSKLEQRGWLQYDSETDQIVYRGHQTAKQLLCEVHEIF